VQDGVNGLLVPVKDVDALAAAMLKLARDPALRERMGAASPRLAQERFDVHKVNQVILDAMGL
jgi:glycosyltransferase involved in cell wall biosynthesis